MGQLMWGWEGDDAYTPDREHLDGDEMTPTCHICGKQVSLTTDAAVTLRGQWFHSAKHDTPVFVLFDATGFVPVALPNGQYALVLDDRNGMNKHAHDACLHSTPEDEYEDEYEHHEHEDGYE